MSSSDENSQHPESRSFRLLLDEDSSSKSSYLGLTEAGYDVATVSSVGLTGKDDSVVLDFAISDERALLTNNHRDFYNLHNENPNHCGILVTFFGTGHAPSMLPSELVQAVNNVDNFVSNGFDLSGQYISLTDYNYEAVLETTSQFEES